MVAFIGYIDRLYNPLRRLVNSSTTLTQSLASMDRVFEFIDEKYDIEDKPDSIELKMYKVILYLTMLIFPIMRTMTCTKGYQLRCKKRGNHCPCWNEWWREVVAC